VIGTPLPVRREPVSEPKVRLFGSDGHFVMRATTQQTAELLHAGLAEWRGRDLRMIAGGGRHGLDGLHVVAHSDGVKNCYGFARRKGGAQ